MSNRPCIKIVGAGLAGCEAAFQAAELGVRVELYEMKPQRFSPAHRSEKFAELVCSNSLRSSQVFNAVGLLKEELRTLGSLVMEAAYATAVPAGSALAVDRELFSSYITKRISEHPLITVHTGCEVSELAEGEITVVATGPLTSDEMAKTVSRLIGDKKLYFFDAAAPIVDAATIDYEKVYFASRYGKGDGADYLNCPMTREEYDAFYHALVSAEMAKLHDVDQDTDEQIKVFEGCMPVEVMAARGYDTLLFGPMKPVGLAHPETGKEPFAVVQLRRENGEGSMYNLVGFQTHLTFPEQRRVFRMIPGLENAEFLRYGVMHRNTYINSPGLLTATYALRTRPELFFAGQMTGVEGYVESAASGFVAGVNAALRAMGEAPYVFSTETMMGAMAAYVSVGSASDFQPMNANFGIIAPLSARVKGGKRAQRCLCGARARAYA